jgi:RHS repeat-associated protein
VYDPFGQATVLDASWGASSDGYAWRYLHQGGRFDAAVGLYSFRFRDYDPVLGRWTVMDPIGFAAGDANWYRYEEGNPLVYLDAIGLYRTLDRSLTPHGNGLIGASNDPLRYDFGATPSERFHGELITIVWPSYGSYPFDSQIKGVNCGRLKQWMNAVVISIENRIEELQKSVPSVLATKKCGGKDPGYTRHYDRVVLETVFLWHLQNEFNNHCMNLGRVDQIMCDKTFPPNINANVSSQSMQDFNNLPLPYTPESSLAIIYPSMTAAPGSTGGGTSSGSTPHPDRSLPPQSGGAAPLPSGSSNGSGGSHLPVPNSTNNVWLPPPPVFKPGRFPIRIPRR